jgi:hypothetical protein
MPRYQLLLKEIAKATPDWRPDHEPLERAIAKLAELQKAIRGCPPLLSDAR